MARKRTNLSPTLVKAYELSVAAPQVIALRSLTLLAPGAAGNAHTSAEVVRMTAEKLQAWHESMTAMGVQIQRAQQEWAVAAMRQWWSACAMPWRFPVPALVPGRAQVERTVARVVRSGLAPVHRRATANAKRLTRSKR